MKDNGWCAVIAGKDVLRPVPLGHLHNEPQQEAYACLDEEAHDGHQPCLQAERDACGEETIANEVPVAPQDGADHIWVDVGRVEANVENTGCVVNIHLKPMIILLRANSNLCTDCTGGGGGGGG